MRTNLATFQALRVGKHFQVDKSFWEVRNFCVELVSAKPCKVFVLCEFLTHKAKQLLDELNVVGVFQDSTHSIDFNWSHQLDEFYPASSVQLSLRRKASQKRHDMEIVLPTFVLLICLCKYVRICARKIQCKVYLVVS